MLPKRVWLAGAVCVLLAAGCAPLEPRSNNISIETVSGNALVTDAQCRVHAGGLAWVVKTPALVPAGDGIGDLVIACEKPGYRASDVVLRGSAAYPASSVSIGLGGYGGRYGGGWRRGGFGWGLGVSQPLGSMRNNYPSRVVVEMTPLIDTRLPPAPTLTQ
ncbi:MAG TPA: hypothetical protein VIT92_08610 [Burkholderiaceae bacterium]